MKYYKLLSLAILILLITNITTTALKTIKTKSKYKSNLNNKIRHHMKKSKQILEPPILNPALPFYVSLAKLSYCPQKTIKALSCSFCDKLIGYTTFFSHSVKDESGIRFKFAILYNDLRSEIVFTFSGPNSEQGEFFNQLYNSGFVFPIEIKGAGIEANYWFIYNNFIKLELINKISQLQASKRGHYKFVFVGHSFGGSIAVLSACDLFNKRVFMSPPMVYTYGQLRIGNHGFVSLVNNNIKIIKVIKKDDYLTRIPGCLYMDKKYNCNMNFGFIENKLPGLSNYFNYYNHLNNHDKINREDPNLIRSFQTAIPNNNRMINDMIINERVPPYNLYNKDINNQYQEENNQNRNRNPNLINKFDTSETLTNNGNINHHNSHPNTHNGLHSQQQDRKYIFDNDNYKKNSITYHNSLHREDSNNSKDLNLTRENYYSTGVKVVATDINDNTKQSNKNNDMKRIPTALKQVSKKDNKENPKLTDLKNTKNNKELNDDFNTMLLQTKTHKHRLNSSKIIVKSSTVVNDNLINTVSITNPLPIAPREYQINRGLFQLPQRMYGRSYPTQSHFNIYSQPYGVEYFLQDNSNKVFGCNYSSEIPLCERDNSFPSSFTADTHKYYFNTNVEFCR